MVVKYVEANDASGRYRWWTPEMAQVGQFEHADSEEEIRAKAAATITLVDITDEENPTW